jgi:hypothetical protein
MSLSRVRRAVLAATAAAAAGLALTVLPAAAAGETPVSGDDRAVAFAGNAKTCAEAHLLGAIVHVGYTIDGSNTYLTITSVPAGLSLTGVVLKGGSAFNVYVGDVRTDLHAPLVSSGQPAQISFWFACGMTPPITSSPPPTPTATSLPPTPPPTATSPPPTPQPTST